MSEKHWFIMKNDQVTGPFELSQAEAELNSDPKCFIWGHGMKEWLTYSQWKDDAGHNRNEFENLSNHTQWKYKLGADSHGPMPYEEMLSELKKLSDYENLEIWSNSLNEWKTVFMLPTVADQLGITRRKHPRVPIMGQIEAEMPSKEIKTFRVISISEGGVGLHSAKSLNLGERFNGTLTSPHLNTTVHCNCTVTYIKENGYVGIEFDSLAPEHLGVIIEYVNKFENLLT